MKLRKGILGDDGVGPQNPHSDPHWAATTAFDAAVESPRKVAGLKGIDIFPDGWDIVDWKALRRSGVTFAYTGTTPEDGEHSGTPIVRPTEISSRPP